MLQDAPLHPEDLYILDSLCEEDAVDAGASIALRLYGDRPTITAIIANTPINYRDKWPWKAGIGFRLMAYAGALASELPIEKQGHLAAISMAHLFRINNMMADFLSCTAIGDMVEGGCAKPFNKPIRSRDGIMPYKKDLRRLTSPAWIRRYIRNDDEARRMRVFASTILERFQHLPREVIVGGVDSFEAEREEVRLRGLVRSQQILEQVRNGVAFEDAHEAVIQGRTIDGRPKIRFTKRSKRVIRERRKIIKRAAVMAENVLGREAVSTFARGGQVEIMGQDAGFLVRRGLTDSGHGALDITVMSTLKEKLGDICFYIDSTPALDQLTALGMHCAAGVEREIIDIANVTSVTAAGAGHPLMHKHKAQPERPEPQRQIIVDAQTGVRFEARASQESINRRNEAYFGTFGSVWIEAHGVHMTGHRNWKHIKGIIHDQTSPDAEAG